MALELTLEDFTDVDICRFWALVSKGENCWEWMGAKWPYGYGIFNLRNKMRKAHRVAFLLSNGFLNSEKLVCHQCDNRICCRPDHLFDGTSLDNSRDAKRKGRTSSGARHSITCSKGSQHCCAKLIEADIPKIKQLRAVGLKIAEIGRMFGVDETVISRISNGKSWRHIT